MAFLHLRILTKRTILLRFYIKVPGNLTASFTTNDIFQHVSPNIYVIDLIYEYNITYH